MNAVVKYVFAVLAGLGVFGFGSKFIVAHMRYDMPAMEASAVYYKMEEAAWKAYPQDPPLTALGKYSHEQAMKEMDGEKDEATRRKLAASIFLGFYLDNGRARAEFCAKYGVDISGFVRTFEEHHADLRAKALAVLADEDTPEEDIYADHKRAMLEHVSYDLLYLDSTALGIKDACAKLVERPYAYLPKMNFSDIEPAIAHTLLSTHAAPLDATLVAATVARSAPRYVDPRTASFLARKAVAAAAFATPPLPLRRALID